MEMVKCYPMWVDDLDGLDFEVTQKALLRDVQQLTQYLRSQFEDYDFACVQEAWQVFCPTIFSEDFVRQGRFWLREVAHKSQDQVLVYAHTYVPFATFSAFESVFVNLKDQSIGEVFLYQQLGLRRSPFKFALLDDAYEDYKRLCKCLKVPIGVRIPARASVFYVQDYPLLIIEYFHPEITC